MQITQPYLLFIGDASDKLSIKMAQGVADWRPELCVGEYCTDECSVTTGIKQMSIEEAAEHGAKSFVLGFANSGGVLDIKWVPTIIKAMEHGMDIVSGLHVKLANIPDIQVKAAQLGRQLFDIRHPEQCFNTGTGYKRTGKRLLTVGTDCSVGKMYTSLSLEKAMKARNIPATFRATGQCGILIAGSGVAIDCVVSDFISGATEQLSPDNEENHWDIIEGQGSLSHPAFAGVSMGLLHGSQPDAIVICHALNRASMRGIDNRPLPTIEETIALNIQLARTTNSKVRIAGISINTSMVSEEEANVYCTMMSNKTGLPCIDPVRHGADKIIENIKS